MGAADINGPISSDVLPLADELRERTGEAVVLVVAVLVVAVLVLLTLFRFEVLFSVTRGKSRAGLVFEEVCNSL